MITPSTHLARGLRLLGAAGCSVLLVAACSSSGASSAPSGSTAPASQAPASQAPASPAPASEPPASAAPSAAASEAASPEASSAVTGATPVPTDIDPCTLLTTDDVSTLAGYTIAAGTSSTDANHDRMCSYGAEGRVIEVLVSVQPDAATAKAQEPEFQATLESAANDAGLGKPKLTELRNFEDGVDAAVMEGSASSNGVTVGGTALWALKGAVLLAISDVALGGKSASLDAIESAAKTALARLP
jgi:hypothetical protein